MKQINVAGIQKLIKDLKDITNEARTQADRLETLIPKVEKLEVEVKTVTKVSNQLVKATDLSDEVMQELINAYPSWESGISVTVGELYSYNNKLYEVVQSHTTQADWTPDNTPALFNEVTPKHTEGGEEIVAEWKQPTGAHDAYDTGDKVLYKGKIYKSKIDNNAHSPEAYPDGWELVE